MMSNKLSIAEATRKIISSHPSVLDCIMLDIVNYSALSRRIWREVAELTGNASISIDAIKIALMRFSERLKEEDKYLENKVAKILAKSTLELKDDVAVITVKQHVLFDKIPEIMRLSSLRFFQLTQGTETITLVVDQRRLPKISKLINEDNILMTIPGQSAIVLISPEEIINVPGVVAYITTILARNNVNITQIISCYTDTIFIISREQAVTAYNVLENLILQLRRRFV